MDAIKKKLDNWVFNIAGAIAIVLKAVDAVIDLVQ